MLTCQSLWRDCVDCFSNKVSSETFQRWFEPIRLETFENNVLTLAVPHNFFLEWFEEHYGNLIIDIVRHNFPANTDVKYIIYTEQPVISVSSEKITKKVKNNKFSHFIEANFDDPENISGLNPSYTFDNFIVAGNSTNSIAKKVSMSVAEKPFNNAFNPVFIYGGVGLGKTHLLNAIGNDIRNKFPELNVFYMQTTVFMDRFINNIASRNSPEFRQFYCSADVVLLDDIQFLNGRHGTQDILFHIFNTLYQNHKQIVFTCDRPTKNLRQMGGMQDRLISRFVSGTSVGLFPPNLETRMAILKSKLTAEKRDIDPIVIEYIAERVDSNVRELEGVMSTALANTLYQDNVDISCVQKIIDNIVANDSEVDRISYAVAEFFNLTIEDIVGKSRQKDIALARHIAMYLANTYTKCTLQKIGALIGGRDHSTVKHAIDNIRNLISTDPDMRKKVSMFEKNLSYDKKNKK